MPARHVAALTVAEFIVQENTGLRERLTKSHVRMKGGSLVIPDAPGLGFELNGEQVRKHRVACTERNVSDIFRFAMRSPLRR